MAAGVGGWGLRAAAARATAGSSTARSTLRAAALTTASHQPVGQVFLYTGRPGWLYLTVESGSGNGLQPPGMTGRAPGHAQDLAGSRGAKHASAAPALTRPGG